MRGALIHGILLAVMLVYGYRTWTRDKTVLPNVGNVVLWDKSEADIASIEYRGPHKEVTLTRKAEGYWWGTDVTIATKARPKKEDAAGSGSAGSAAGSGSAGSASGSGSAGSASGSGSAGSGSAAKKEPEVYTIEEDETGRTTREFPVGEAAEKLIKQFAAARAMRSLGKPNDAQVKDYKLGGKPANILYAKDGTKVDHVTITVKFKDGSSRSFMIGGNVYASSDKYAMDTQSGKAYVFSKDMLTGLEVGEPNLHLTDPRGYDATKIGSVIVEAGGRSKTFTRTTTKGGADNSQQVKTWADPTTGKPDQTAANFIDNANNLKPTEYAAQLKISELTPVLKLTYKEEHGAQLGTLTLYKREKPGELLPGQELDPANPPKSETQYYIVTEKTRVPGLVHKDTAQRMEQDIDTVFSGKGAEVHSVDPKGNPFGPVPPGALGSGAPGIPGMGPPPGGPAMPGAGSAGPGMPNPHAGIPGMGTPGATPGGPGSTPGPTSGAGSAAKAPTPAPAAGSAAKAPTPVPAPAPTPAPKAPAPPPPAPPAPAPAAAGSAH